MNLSCRGADVQYVKENYGDEPTYHKENMNPWESRFPHISAIN